MGVLKSGDSSVAGESGEPKTVRLPVTGPGLRRSSATTANAVGLTEPIPLGPPAGPAGASVAQAAPGNNGSAGDGLALSLSQGINTLAGFGTWLIAAQIMSQGEFGLASAWVSAFILIASVTQLNLGVGLLRWIPSAGSKAPRLVWSALWVIMPLSAVAGLLYALAVPDLARTASGTFPTALGVVLFVLAAAGWGVFVVHDFVLVAIGRPWWTVWRNALFSVVRLGLLVVLAGVLGWGAQGLVVSWVVPIVVWIGGGSVALAVMVRRFARVGGPGSVPGAREAGRFLGPTAVAAVGVGLLFNQVPILVTLRFGPELGAAFYITWQAVTVIDIAAMFFMNSLSVHVAREPGRAAELAATARRRLFFVFLPILVLAGALARPVLSIFGPGYAEATPVLQVILAGLALRLVVAHELGVRQARGLGLAFARLQLGSTVLVLVVVAVVPVVAGPADVALMPIAIGYVAVQLVSAIAAVAFRSGRGDRRGARASTVRRSRRAV